MEQDKVTEKLTGSESVPSSLSLSLSLSLSGGGGGGGGVIETNGLCHRLLFLTPVVTTKQNKVRNQSYGNSQNKCYSTQIHCTKCSFFFWNFWVGLEKEKKKGNIEIHEFNKKKSENIWYCISVY